jgi:hypothetical protein
MDEARLNKITRANAGGPRRLTIRKPWTARIAQFRRWAQTKPAPIASQL